MARKCNDCEKQLNEIADKPINCDLCDHWYDMACSGIDLASYKVLTEKKNDGVMWLCLHCRKSMPGFNKLMVRMQQLDEGHETLKKSIEVIETGKKDKKDVEGTVFEIFREQEMREERKCNVMIFGVADSKEENPTDRRNEDLDSVNKLVSHAMGGEAVAVERLVRIGKLHHENSVNAASGQASGVEDESQTQDRVIRPKVRPIKVFFDNVQDKRKALESLRTAINSERSGKYKYIYCESDLTFRQREEEAERKKERYEKWMEHDKERADRAMRLSEPRSSRGGFEPRSSRGGFR